MGSKITTNLQVPQNLLESEQYISQLRQVAARRFRQRHPPGSPASPGTNFVRLHQYDFFPRRHAPQPSRRRQSAKPSANHDKIRTRRNPSAATRKIPSPWRLTPFIFERIVHRYVITGNVFAGEFPMAALRPGLRRPSSLLFSTGQIALSLSLPPHLRRPPSRPHKQKSPILKKFGRFPLHRMANKLQNPPQQKQPPSHPPNPMPHNPRQKQRQGNNDKRYPKRMRKPVYRMLMPFRVLRNPAIPTPSSQHKSPCFIVPPTRQILTPTVCPHKGMHYGRRSRSS